MMRKNKAASKTEETSLARPKTDSPFAWFDEMDHWSDDVRRGIEERFWGPLTRWGESGLRVRRARGDAGRREGRRRPDRGAARNRDPRGDGPLPGGEGQGVLLPGAQLPSASPVPLVPRGDQDGPRGGDAEGRRLGSPRPEEGADPGFETRQGAGRVNPLPFPFLCGSPMDGRFHEFK